MALFCWYSSVGTGHVVPAHVRAHTHARADVQVLATHAHASTRTRADTRAQVRKLKLRTFEQLAFATVVKARARTRHTLDGPCWRCAVLRIAAR